MMSVMSAGADWCPSGASGVSGAEEVEQTSFKCWDVLIPPASQPIIMGNLLVIHNAALGSSRSSVSLSFILSSQSVSVQVLTLPRKQFWH